MIKRSILILALATSFIAGFAFNAIFAAKTSQQPKMKRVTGIGGIFFKCKDPKTFKEWYKTHLDIDAGAYGAKFDWRQDADSAKKGYTLWTPFSEKTKYFDPSSQSFMINYRVQNLQALVDALNSEGVTVLDKIEVSDFGKFVHILDLEGNKIELWEAK